MWAALTLSLALAAAPEYRVLFFTAPWCGPCRAVDAVLEKRVTSQAARRVEVVIVDFDEARTEAEARWGVREIPVVIVLRADGKMVLRADGAERGTLKNLEKALRELLQPPKKKERK